MIYELLTLDLKPRTIPPVEEALGRAHEALGAPDDLVGSFHTEFGPLNQIVQIRRYADLAERDRLARDREEATARWHRATSGHVLSAVTQIMQPVSFSPVLAPGRLGPFYELRTYAFPLGTLPVMMAAWERAMPMRDALGSPVAAIWSCGIGAVNTLTHLWPYPSLEDREDIRRKVRVGGKWPPYRLDEQEGGKGYDLLGQVNKIMLPATFSPLQ